MSQKISTVSRSSSIVRFATLLRGLAVITAFAATPAHATIGSPAALYDRTMAAVRDGFHDRTFRGQPFDELVTAGRRELGDQRDRLGPITQAIFQRLAPVAPLLATEDDQIYWTLKNAALGKLDGAPVRHIGAWFERRGKRWFVSEVFLGSPAAAAGLIRGDEIVAVDGQPFTPVRSFRSVPSTARVKLELRRLPGEAPRVMTVDTVSESFHATMERSMRRSYRVAEVGRKRVAYVSLPAATHSELRATFLDLARRAESQADAMVLDLRGGYGSLDVTYAEAFFRDGPKPAVFTKPLVVLVGRGTTSGREWLARLVQGQKRGRIVGEPTPGTWRPGRLVDLAPDAALLYLGAADAAGTATAPAVADGQGVQPDIPVDQSLMYAAGEDAPLKAALTAAAKG